MGDFSKFFATVGDVLDKTASAACNVAGEVSKKATKYMPTALSEDRRFSKAYAATLGLLICADRQVEEEETIAALQFIQNDSFLKKENLVAVTIQDYADIIKDVQPTFIDVPAYLVKKSLIIEDTIRVSLNNNYKKVLKNLCNTLVGSDANQQEKEVASEILEALQ